MLALRIGATVRELKRRMTHREFIAWTLFYRLSPFDDERCFDAPAARVAEQLSISRKGKARFKDFLPHRETKIASKPKPKKQSELSENEMGYLRRPLIST